MSTPPRLAAFHKVRYEFVPIERTCRLGMKLHAVERQPPMTNCHDRPVVTVGIYNKARRKTLFCDNEGVVARDGEQRGHAAKQALAIRSYHRDFPVHRAIATYDTRTVCRSDYLMPQANAQKRHTHTRGQLHDLNAVATIGRTFRSWRYDDSLKGTTGKHFAHVGT